MAAELNGSMNYGGLDEKAWGRLLHNHSLVVRLSALRACALSGEDGARALLTGPSFTRPDESYPWVWALSRCVEADLFRILRLSGHPSHGPLSRVRFLVRRAQRPHEWRVQRSRSECVGAMLEALHPLQTLACAVRLLEMHGDRAIPALLEVIRQQPPALAEGHGRQLGKLELLDEKAECAAWALGQLGRVAVPEIVHCYAGASQRVRCHLAMALWYLGVQAHKALAHLLRDPSPQASAALLALESRASLAMVEQRRGPVWLDEDSVCALAGIAFSDENRVYAAASLGCFGPAARRGLPILKHLAADPEVRATVARALSWGGRVDTLPLIFQLAEDSDKNVRQRALNSLAALHKSPQVARAALFEYVLTGTPVERAGASAKLSQLGLPPDHDEEVDQLLHSAEEPVVVNLLGALARTPGLAHQDVILELLQRDSLSIRRSAAVVLAKYPDSEPVRRLWLRLLWDKDWELVTRAVQALVPLELTLAEMGLGENELMRVPVKTLAYLLGEMRPCNILPTDMLPVLQRPEAKARLAAATALGCFQTPLPMQILEALVATSHDESPTVALACVRTLLVQGFEEHRCELVLSASLDEQEEGWESLRLCEGMPVGLLEAFRQGKLVNDNAFNVLREKLPRDRFLDLLSEALPNIQLKDRPLLVKTWASLGVAGLDRLPELLGDPLSSVRQLCLQILDTMLTMPLDPYVEWLAERGLVLPLQQPDIQAELHEILARFLLRVQARQDPRLTSLLAELSRSPVASAASLSLMALGQAYSLRAEPAVLELIVAGLLHSHADVRREAFCMMSRLPSSAWIAVQATDYVEGQVLQLACRFQREGLETAELAGAIRLAQDSVLISHIFAPTSTSQVRQLLSLLKDRVGFTAMQLLWLYLGPLDAASWRAVLAAANDPACAAHHGQLVRRWPRLVVSALVARPDGAEWLRGLAGTARPGLQLALSHKQAKVRLRTLLALHGWDVPLRGLRDRLRALAKEDDHPEVRSLAAGLLKKWKE